MSNEITAVGLDIGTSKVRCIIGEPSADGKLNILGAGESDSKGLRRGVVTSAEAVAESIRKAVAEAERVSGVEVDAATVNLSGEHFRGENKAGVVAVAGADKEITQDDVDRATDSASALPLQPGWEIVDRLPQEYIVDGQDGIIEPVGMTGSRLEARVHVVVSPSAGRQNLVKAVSRAGMDVEQTILEPLAAAESTLSDDDREYGCVLLNIGAEITGITVFSLGAVKHMAVFPFGSTHFTTDLAAGLRVSIPQANKIKHDYGCVASFLLSDDERMETIEIMPVGRSESRGLSKELLCDIMQPRAVELLQHIAREVRTAEVRIPSGVIMTGGGAMTRGICEIAEQIFDAPTRIGFLENEYFAGLMDSVQTPDWAVAGGLAQYSMRSQIRGQRYGGTSPVRKVTDWIEGIRDKFR
ncbi:MAG TPA: cell division protein FtsA [Pyrinomonadaceae bacterium]|nr:cell division protein FtsA [Pyrinomonadaceae bacterium]